VSSLIDQARNTANCLRRQARRHGWLRLPDHRPIDAGVKPAPYLPIYEELLRPLRRQAFTLLELGVWGGHSLEMWRDAFPRAAIIGVDLDPPNTDLGRRVVMFRGDQADPVLMQRVRDTYAPRGFDVIIDDASHIGITTAQSLQVLYREHLRPGGLYCIEDWGTGYLPDWHDGGRMVSTLDIRHLDSSTVTMRDGVAGPIPMPSHDIGAVCVIKSLIDHTASATVRMGQPDLVGNIMAIDMAIDSMTVWNGS
jgi:SAM-dependent methyltransferase